MQSRILLRGYAREGGTPSLATHPQNQQQHQEQNQNQEQHQNQNQNQNQLQNQGRLHRGLDTPSWSRPRIVWRVFKGNYSMCTSTFPCSSAWLVPSVRARAKSPASSSTTHE